MKRFEPYASILFFSAFLAAVIAWSALTVGEPKKRPYTIKNIAIPGDGSPRFFSGTFLLTFLTDRAPTKVTIFIRSTFDRTAGIFLSDLLIGDPDRYGVALHQMNRVYRRRNGTWIDVVRQIESTAVVLPANVKLGPEGLYSMTTFASTPEAEYISHEILDGGHYWRLVKYDAYGWWIYTAEGEYEEISSEKYAAEIAKFHTVEEDPEPLPELPSDIDSLNDTKNKTATGK
jgi:hypothetical protein